MKLCSIDGCDGKHIAKGFCNKHYKRYKIYNDPNHLDESQKNRGKSLIDRLFIGFNKELDGCWIWQGAKSHNGYGLISEKKQGKTINYRVHRLMYEINTGEQLKNDELICHKCDNPACCNPDHLFKGSHDENMQDMVVKRRSSWGEKNRNSKLSIDDINNIRELWENRKLSQGEIAEKFQVSKQHIWRVIHHEAWFENVEEKREQTGSLKKLSDEMAEVIRKEYRAGGITYKELGDKYGIHKATVYRIMKNKIHKVGN